MLGPNQLNGEMTFGTGCEDGLPREGGEVGGDAQSSQAVVACFRTLEQPSVGWYQCPVDELLGCGLKGVELLPQNGPSARVCPSLVGKLGFWVAG